MGKNGGFTNKQVGCFLPANLEILRPNVEGVQATVDGCEILHHLGWLKP